EILDRILEAYIEHNKDTAAIIQQGFSEKTVRSVIEKLVRSEYKRRQAPPGIRITSRAFGRDWRYPITSHYPPALKSAAAGDEKINETGDKNGVSDGT